MVAVFLQITHKILWRCNACEQKNVFVSFNAIQRTAFSAKHRLKVVVFNSRKQQSLIRIKVHRLCDDSEIHGAKAFRAFCDNHDVCTVLPFLVFPHAASRQELVVNKLTMVVNKQNIDSWFYIPMLESIIKQYHVSFFCLLVSYQSFNAVTSFFINSHINVREFPLHLKRFVPDISDCRILVGKHKPFRLALVSPTKNGNLGLAF